MSSRYFITGIGTDVGKTVVSAIFVRALQADYWKPIQAGTYEMSDREKVQMLSGSTSSKFHPEAYLLREPLSPHASAKLEGLKIETSRISPPSHSRPLVIEGAGGLMVPLNDKDLVIDLIGRFEAKVILVSRHYLGSINHTLLSIDALRNRGLSLSGLIFIGAENAGTEEAILSRSSPQFWHRIPEVAEVTPGFVTEQSLILSERMRNERLV